MKLFKRSTAHRADGYAENEGVRIWFVAYGKGRGLLLHHGFGGRGRDWADAGYVTALVEAGFRVVTMDARGHGLSDKPHEATAYTVDARVRDIVAVLDAAGEGEVDYWGYSMGGWIGFALLHAHPERVRRFVAGAAAAAPGSAFREEAGVAAEALERGDLSQLSQGDMPAEVARRLVEGNDLAALAALQRATMDWHRADLAYLATPSLHYAGALDSLLEQSRMGAHLMPGSRFEIIDDSDHLTAFLRSRSVLPRAVQFLQQP